MQTAMGTSESIDLTGAFWQESSCGWTPATPANERGKPRFNRNVAGGKLIVNRLPYEKGIGVAGKSFLICSPKTYASSLELLVGIDDSTSAKNASAYFEVFGNGKQLFSTALSKNKDPKHCRVRLIGIDELVLIVDAPTNVHVDILIPNLIGAPGLEYELTQEKKSYEDYTYAQPEALKNVKVLFNDAIAFPYNSKKFGSCLGMSNDYICVIISPGHAGKMIHFGPDAKENLLDGTSGILLYPLERRIADVTPTYSGTWKWKFDSDGVLKLLSPPDLLHGIKWLRTFYLVPGTTLLKTAVHIKNVTRADVSWSAGTYFDISANSAIAMRAESAKPGYTFQKSPPDNLVVSDNMLLLSDYKTSSIGGSAKNYDVITSAEGWFCAVSLKNKKAFLMKPVEPKFGLYPYGGTRIFVVRTPGKFRVTALSELTPLSPGKSFSQNQFWIIGDAVTDAKTTVSDLKLKIENDISSATGHGVPTGRTLNNYN